MQTRVAYQFPTAQIANRFLNTLTPWSVTEVTAKFYQGSDSVLVTYEFDGQGFDSTSSDLDDLADSMGGQEIPS